MGKFVFKFEFLRYFCSISREHRFIFTLTPAGTEIEFMWFKWVPNQKWDTKEKLWFLSILSGWLPFARLVELNFTWILGFIVYSQCFFHISPLLECVFSVAKATLFLFSHIHVLYVQKWVLWGDGFFVLHRNQSRTGVSKSLTWHRFNSTIIFHEKDPENQWISVKDSRVSLLSLGVGG